MRLRFLAPAALVLVCATTGARADLRLGHQVLPRFESVHLTVDAKKTDYSGSVHLDLDVTAVTDSFRLNSRGLTIQSLKLAGPSGAVATTHVSRDQGLLVVRAAKPLKMGRYGLDIEFTNAFNTQAISLYRLETGGHAYTF